jgi:hypothetical protein
VAIQLVDAPRDLLVDNTNDMVVTTDAQWSRGLVAVAQSCRIKLQLFAGEWFLNLDAGVPYWDQILAQKDPVAIKAANIAFRQALLEVDDVLSVTRLDITFDRKTRTMRIVWQVNTVFGETPPDTLPIIGKPGATT